MSHDPERLAARWLGADMGWRERRRYEEHLLACEACWAEVDLARRGRALAEIARELAPTELRDRLRTAVAARAAADPRAPSRRPLQQLVIVAAAVVTVASVVAVVTVRPWNSSSTHSAPGTTASIALADAVASYRDNRLPGTAVPTESAPDLAAVGLRVIGAATGTVNATNVTVFVYTDAAGARLTLYRSAHPFTEGAEATELNGPEGAWVARSDGVDILCSRGAHSLLILGVDADLVHRVATVLNAI